MVSIISKMDNLLDSDKPSSKIFGIIITALIMISVFVYFKLIIYVYITCVEELYILYEHQYPFVHKHTIDSRF
nr:CPPV323 putative P-type ATPase [Cooks petrelpox virus]